VRELEILADERAPAGDLVEQHRDVLGRGKRKRDIAATGVLKLCDRSGAQLADGDVEHTVRQLIRNRSQPLEQVEGNRTDSSGIERAATELDEGNPLPLGPRPRADGGEPVSHRSRAHGHAARGPAG
jgi:hypothetical protein